MAGIHQKRLVFVMAAGVQQQKVRQAGVCSKALTVRHRGQYSGGRNPPEKASFRHGSRVEKKRTVIHFQEGWR